MLDARRSLMLDKLSLQEYCKNATLPSMHFHDALPHRLPALGQSSRLSTMARPVQENENLLLTISPMDVERHPRSRTETIPPSSFQNHFKHSTTFDMPKLRGSELFELQSVRNDEDVLVWVHNTALKTLVRVLDIEEGGLARWDISLDCVKKLEGVPVFFLTLRQCSFRGDDAGPWENRICVCVVAPWNLSAEDMWSFSAENSTRFIGGRLTDRRWTNIHGSSNLLRGESALWYQILMQCRETGVNKFVLTSYSNWSFGTLAGAKDMMFAKVSSPIQSDAYGPTILQCLLSWARLKPLKTLSERRNPKTRFTMI
ncbi:hypothetical protein BOTBODRAFT_606854 [Botryobasidium botryosum FD-172 SS1]|uniref:Uncharacterized protein n=1 Tax=Botryobasidium botryosum (strain FD-172 SS1) TaxID=930990 RepID=A0A067N0Z4_BOTB1|nr:hypothetical protein BOTBODRAFT_606854 [Botryobasidium botryosum FD-172 SS1]